MRVAVIGAGPMGIAAAIGAADRGHDVTVLERGEVGASLRTWGPTRFFSPLQMNVSARMRELLGGDVDDDALLTGDEYVDRVLLPLVNREPLRGRVHTQHAVTAIGRRGLTRGDYAGHPLRAERPFRIVVDAGSASRSSEFLGVPRSSSAQGSSDPSAERLTRNASPGTPHQELVFEADVILDASGGLTVPRPMGIGGLPALGESRLVHRPIRTLGELAARLPDIRGKRILILGDGHSAATAIGMLAESGPAQIIWAVRSPNRRPCEEVFPDPLPERRNVVERANALAENPPGCLRVERRAMIEGVAQTNGHVSIALTGGRSVDADFIAAFTGYRPGGAFLSELTVETSPVTEGGARLYRAISTITDCLSVPNVKPEDLQSGEPGYFFVGSRSYGRSNGFLLRTGLSQLETILQCIPNRQ